MTNVLATKSDRGVRLFSRNNKSLNLLYPDIVEALGELSENTVVDGEIVALDESRRPNFNLLQNYRNEAARIHFFIFDVLVYEDRDLTRLPLFERREFIFPIASRHLQRTCSGLFVSKDSKGSSVSEKTVCTSPEIGAVESPKTTCTNQGLESY